MDREKGEEENRRGDGRRLDLGGGEGRRGQVEMADQREKQSQALGSRFVLFLCCTYFLPGVITLVHLAAGHSRVKETMPQSS